jgi:hypothetical protein
VKAMKLTSSLIAAVLDTSPLIVLTIKTDGTFINSFKDTSTYSGSNTNLIVDGGVDLQYSSTTSYQVFLSMTNKDNKWQVIAFKQDASI